MQNFVQVTPAYFFAYIAEMIRRIWQYIYTSLLRAWLKWLLRKTTGTCELQRICSGNKPGATMTKKAGKILLQYSSCCRAVSPFH